MLLACASVYFAERRGAVGRFSARDNSQGAGNTAYSAIITDWRTRNEYPIFDFQDETGKPVGIGVIGVDGKACLMSDLRSMSK